MDTLPCGRRCEYGFVLVTVMLILLILTIIGIMATKTSTYEMMVSGNEKVHRQTFYQADGSSELAERLIFENAVCASVRNTFTKNVFGSIVNVIDNQFAENISPLADPVVSNANRSAAYYPGGVVNDLMPHSNFLSEYTDGVNPGSAMQMVSGYEGLGAGTPGGGTHRLYLVSSQHRGLVNSESLVRTRWRIDNFILSSAALSDCKY